MILFKDGEKVNTRISILSETLLVEEYEKRYPHGKPEWKRIWKYGLPSPEDVVIVRKGLFSRVITIKVKDKKLELYSKSDKPSKLREEIISTLQIASVFSKTISGSIVTMLRGQNSPV
jgi:hypothetical protein